MALADKIFNITRRLEMQVIVNGVWLVSNNPTEPTGTPGVVALQTSRSFDSPVPVCTVTVNRIPEWIQRGQSVEVNLGFGGEMVRAFTGHLLDREPGYEAGRLNCGGRLHAAFRSIELPDRDVTGKTTKEAIEEILDYVGLTTNREIPAATFTLGSASTAILNSAASSQMINTVMEAELWQMYEDANGKVIIIGELAGPAVVAWRAYTTDTTATARILGSRSQEDPGYARTRVKVIGAMVTEGSPPDETSRTITYTATLIGETPVQPPLPAGTTIDTARSNHLIDTDARAEFIAAKLLSHYARVPRQVALELPGDPQLELGQTIRLEIPRLLLSGRFLIWGLEHIVDDTGFVTQVDLRGGDEFGGTVRVNPLASFNYSVEREVFGTKEWIFVTLDSSASQGRTAEIASYAWADNQAVETPNITGLTDAVITIRIDPDLLSGDYDVTLTVTDDDGLTGTATQTLELDPGASPVRIPAIFAAIGNNMSATPDGGQNWNDDADADVLSCAAAPPDGVTSGYGVYGLDDGSIMRTTDFLATAATEVKAAGGGGIVSMAWDWRNPLLVWAVDDEANLYISTDRGATWGLYSALRTVLSLGSATLRHIGLPAGGGVWVYGGDGANNPLIAYDAVIGGFSWTQLSFNGDLGDDLPANSANVRIMDAVNKGDGGGLVIIMENADAGDSEVRPIYHTDNVFDPDAWVRATGFGAGDVDGRYVVADVLPGDFYAGFADRHIWYTTSDAKPAWTKRTDVLPANHVARHCIWPRGTMPGYVGIYLLALEDTSAQTAGIYKSADGLQTVGALRPATGFPAWPASAIGRQVAVGAPAAVSGEDALLVVQSSVGSSPDIYERDVATLAGAIWAKQEDTASVNQAVITNVKKLGDNHYRILSDVTTHTAYDMHCGQLQRSSDGGLNWSNVGPSPATSGGFFWGVQDMAIDAAGTLWLIATSDVANAEAGFEPEIWQSINDGVDWTKIWEETTFSVSWLFFLRIVCHPTDANIIAVIGDERLGNARSWHTATGGAPFTLHTGAAGQTGVRHRAAVMWGNGRMLQTQYGNAWVSDDYGATAWTIKDDIFLFVYALAKGLPGHAYIGHGNGVDPKLSRTKDYGETWETICDEDDFDASVSQLGGLVYDVVSDTLYIATNENATPNLRVFALPGASTVLAGDAGSQIIHNLTYGLDALFNEPIAPRGIALK